MSYALNACPSASTTAGPVVCSPGRSTGCTGTPGSATVVSAAEPPKVSSLVCGATEQVEQPDRPAVRVDHRCVRGAVARPQPARLGTRVVWQVGDDEAIDVLTDLIHRGVAGTPPGNQERSACPPPLRTLER
jgi:hypothetical protein